MPAGSGSGGGSIDVSSTGDITIGGRIDTSAADFGGGSVSLSLRHRQRRCVTQPMDVSGGGPDGSGGSVDITATLGSVTLSSTITGKAGSGTDFACGDGSEVSIFSGGTTTIGAAIDVSGGTQCFGGEITVDTGLDFIQLASGSIAARGPGSFGGGGSFLLGAGRNATLRSIDLTSPGFGGTADVIATGTLDILGVIDAEASGNEGIGGLLTFQACAINIAATGFLDSRGSFAFPGTGSNRLRAGGLVTVLGQMRAKSANDIQHRGLAPVITGTVVPAATISVNPNLPDCVQLAQCNNTVVDEGEACDDGNNASCDGCSSDCSRIDDVCGDGTRECGEQCDDGNTTSGDGCEADCTLPRAGRRAAARRDPAHGGLLRRVEARVRQPGAEPEHLLPSSTQICTDGDPGCDIDQTRDGVCTFGAQLCLRVPDTRLPECTPDAIALHQHQAAAASGRQQPARSGQRAELASAVQALGGEVRESNDGPADAARRSPARTSARRRCSSRSRTRPRASASARSTSSPRT